MCYDVKHGKCKSLTWKFLELFQHRTYWEGANIIKTKRKKENSLDLLAKGQTSWISPADFGSPSLHQL